MTITAEQEVWAVALWVEKHHGNDGPRYIAEQIGRLALADDGDGVELWKRVAGQYESLRSGRSHN